MSAEENAHPLSQRTIPRPEHKISRANISAHALKVLYRLKKAGFEAYLVGGGVRDLLLERAPKDFDIATSAHPEEVSRVFRNCRLIGRRFRLAHVYFGNEVIEVATFRAGEDANKRTTNQSGRILHDNVYGSLEEDAQRRDFTVNAIYYNIADFSLTDFSSGFDHLQRKKICLIGDPAIRFREDPVRMLRAVRFAAKLQFSIEARCVEPIKTLGELLHDVPPARLYDETMKLFLHGQAYATLQILREYQLFDHLFPVLKTVIRQPDVLAFLEQAMRNTDQRISEKKPVTPAFLFAVLLWGCVRQEANQYSNRVSDWIDSIQVVGDQAVKHQQKRISIPRRIIHIVREIWFMQPRFMQKIGKKPLRFMSHPKFRASYDFFLLRASVGEVDPEIAAWWTRLQSVNEVERKKMTQLSSQQRKKPAVKLKTC